MDASTWHVIVKFKTKNTLIFLKKYVADFFAELFTNTYLTTLTLRCWIVELLVLLGYLQYHNKEVQVSYSEFDLKDIWGA